MVVDDGAVFAPTAAAVRPGIVEEAMITLDLDTDDSNKILVSDPETGLHLKAFPLFCNNSDCSFLQFSFEENGERLKPGKFSITVDTDSWQEHSPPSRPERVTQIVDSFLSLMPEHARAVFQSSLDRKYASKRLAEHHFSREELQEGLLVSYLDIITKDGSLCNGGWNYEYHLHHMETEYLVVDSYCPNPKCECLEVTLDFFELDPVSVTECLSVRVGFDGFPTHQEHASAGFIGALRAQYPDFPMTLKSRYREIKKVAVRSLAQYRKEDRQILKDCTARKVGRNDRCPCGSGNYSAG